MRPFLFALALSSLLASACGGGSKSTTTPPPFATHTIEIDIDDHGLAGLWMANAPNLKGLIARGTFAFSRVVVPTHSNQNNMALITGQYPDGDNVPANAWLSRTQNFGPPINLPGLSIGDYTDYGRNPLLTRGDSVYHAVQRAGGRTAYFGQLPPFEAGADEVHLSIVGATFGATTITAPFAMGLLTDILHYPKAVVAGYHLDGPPPAGESYLTFTLRNAAAFIRATTAQAPLPSYMFIWDFIAIDDDPTSSYGADGNAIVQVVEEYDAALGDVLAALQEKSLLDSTNILFTLDHGKVDTHNQVALGSHGESTDTTGATIAADGQLGALVAAQGAALGITPADYAILNEDGDAQIYARVAGAGTDAGAASQATVTHALLSLIQSGQIQGLDITRTMTADGAMGTRTFHDFRGSSPNTADIVVFPIDDWTLNQVDASNAQPGPVRRARAVPLRPPRRLLRRRALRAADPGRPGVQAGRAGPAPGRAPRRRRNRGGGAGDAAPGDGGARPDPRGARRRSDRGLAAARRHDHGARDGARRLGLWRPPGAGGAARDRGGDHRRRWPLRRGDLLRRRARGGRAAAARPGGDRHTVQRRSGAAAATGRSRSTSCSPAATRR